MYKLHLILKYLRKRRIAWVSLIAVMLCTTMVLVVISVMGGWLRMFRQSFHGLTGDVIIEGRTPAGFPYYDDMVKRLEQLPDVQAAVPVINTFGLVRFGGTLKPVTAVQVMGYPIDRIGLVNNFPQSLYRQTQLRQEPKERAEQEAADLKLDGDWNQPVGTPSFKLLPFINYEAAFGMVYPKATAAAMERSKSDPGMIVGAGVVGISKDKDGNTVNRSEVMYRVPVTLTVLDVNSALSGRSLNAQPETKRFYWVVDDSRTKVWQYDNKTVYVPFEVLQSDLGMSAGDDGSPARTTELHVKVKDGVDLMAARGNINAVVHQVLRDHGERFRVDGGDANVYADDPLSVQTWEQTQALWLGAIEHEKLLVTILFGIISIVAIFLIFCIFYMIVAEKTRDIGIIKSVGATSSGVAGIFLGYGLAIGIVGSFAGFGVGYLIVRYINELHAWLSRFAGITIWNPEVYAFDTIPNTMNPREVVVIMGIAIVASVLGAVIPAVRAARMHPVEALRWE